VLLTQSEPLSDRRKVPEVLYSGAEVEELAHVAEFLLAGVEEFLDALVGKDEELAFEGVTGDLAAAS
jgi:hypothetical protein